MNKWGNAMYVTPGIVVDGKLVTTNLVDINLNIRILLGSSYYEGWENDEKFVNDPLRNSVDQNHPWNQTTTPKPQKRDFAGKYTWVMSPRWFDKRTGDHLAIDTGGGPDRPDFGPPHWPCQSRHRLHQGDRKQRQDVSAEDHLAAGG